MPERRPFVCNLEFVIWNFPEGVLLCQRVSIPTLLNSCYSKKQAEVAIPCQRVSIPTAGQIGLVVMRVSRVDFPRVPTSTPKGVSPK